MDQNAATMTKGQMEAGITAAMTRFERDYLGRGPHEARTFIIQDLVLVRLKGILSPAELKLSADPGGVELVKQMRSRLVEGCRDALAELIAHHTGLTMVSMHADISARSGERVFVFALSDDLEAVLAAR